MPSISNKWIDKLDMLPAKDYITLTKAILRDEPEPQITPKYQGIASDIYKDIAKANYQKNAMRKSRKKINSELTVNLTVNQPLINGELTVKQEEKREAPPPCSPSSSPPHPLNITPYNPPPEEKREESPPDTGAGACVKGGGRSRRDRFEELWKIYPKKTGKTNAFADYERAVKDGVTDEEIRDGINRYCEYIRTGQLTGRYILGGSTYFRQRRWQDVYNPPDNGRGGMSEEDWEEMNAVFG